MSSLQADRVRIDMANILQRQRAEASRGSSIIKLSFDDEKFYIKLPGDAHLLTVALAHLCRAMKDRKLPRELKSLQLSGKLQEDIENLRHILEHWPQTRPAFEGRIEKTKSAKKYADAHPSKNPWSVSLNDEGFVLNGILDLNELQSSVTAIEEYFYSILP